ncbi:T9SS type A sorting domain-containing protein [Rurimicrobium arvi]|uniref:Secretion system C-terminal sorting domain-containing protein n=1 Tax=Rurimicrobium arvi TaxID=2049916 RepID=A0ABP8MV87_9BACT
MKEIFTGLTFCFTVLTAGAQVSTLSGSGIAGYLDGTATSAQFNYPNGIGMDKAGNFYVADWNNHMIRKISPTGVVSTFAGTGVRGYMDGPAATAQFNDPWGIAVDGSDNVYVADAKNNVIRKITPAGIVSTLAGSGIASFADGTGTAASFNYPAGIGVDDAGNVYVGDGNNNRVRKITPAGVTTTVAGDGSMGSTDGPAASASFYGPNTMVITSTGDIYITDVGNCRIRKISGGYVTTFAGSTMGTADGKGTAAQFNKPHGILLDADGTFFVADTENNRIRKIAADGTVTTLTGSAAGFSDGPFNTALFSIPKCIASDKKGNLYITDEHNNRVRKLTGVATGVKEATGTREVSLYPNPAKDMIDIHCPAAEATAQIQVYNMLGQLVLEKTVATPNYQLNERISLSQLTPGNYSLQVISGNTKSAGTVSKY